MKIIFSDDQDEVKVPKEAVALLKKGLQAVAKLHKLSAETEVSVSLVSDEVIHVLNKDYRGIDRPTDVLSFALDEAEEPQEFGGPDTHLLGDIIISAETAVRQGEEYGHGLNRELVYLGVHSLLHLLGYDHMTPEDEKKMFSLQKKIVGDLA
jgi:probable rRNA maturation factor